MKIVKSMSIHERSSKKKMETTVGIIQSEHFQIGDDDFIEQRLGDFRRQGHVIHNIVCTAENEFSQIVKSFCKKRKINFSVVDCGDNVSEILGVVDYLIIFMDHSDRSQFPGILEKCLHNHVHRIIYKRSAVVNSHWAEAGELMVRSNFKRTTDNFQRKRRRRGQ